MILSLGFLMGVDLISGVLALGLFAFAGLGIFLIIQFIFGRLQKAQAPMTKTMVFLTLVVTPALMLLLGLASYGLLNRLSEQTYNRERSTYDSIERATEISPNSVNISDDIKIDTVTTVDSVTNAEISLMTPVSTITTLDLLVRSNLETRSRNFLNYMQGVLKEDSTLFDYGSVFTVEVISAHRDENVISYLFQQVFYYPTVECTRPEYFSIHYDIAKNKRITFHDYFNVKSPSDTSLLNNQIRLVLNEKVHLSAISAVDFTITPESIWFNFHDYELGTYAGDITHAKVPKKNLDPLIRPAYK